MRLPIRMGWLGFLDRLGGRAGRWRECVFWAAALGQGEYERSFQSPLLLPLKARLAVLCAALALNLRPRFRPAITVGDVT